MASDEGARDFWRVLAAYFFPPLGVFMQSGIGGPLFINCLLSVCLFVPGQIHAVWHISTVGEDGAVQEGGTGTFVSLLLAYYLPPIGVFMKVGFGIPLLISVILSGFYFPGVVHAIFVITNETDE